MLYFLNEFIENIYVQIITSAITKAKQCRPSFIGLTPNFATNSALKEKEL